ncbi:hypothetical protein JVX91_06330 [Pseudomonas sp. PDNC002]|uniref:hypothetical protein n=1 Tax=Pseudomonas sp. PDNC002 TaxID=2811422 RepID=UPI001964E142|nr:hypothetical protein [Pseudomonas sp. PDNC002]QRY80720.1 hypothetical protein JVX91_06330 [Pseudomonas sp. PDNC002]
MSPKEWLSIWNQLDRGLRRQALQAWPLLMALLVVAAMVGSIVLVGAVRRVVGYM